MKYLPNTNICMELIRKQPAKLVHRLTTLRVGKAGVSTITVAELPHGVSKSSRPEQNLAALEQFLLPLAIADFDYAAAAAYGQIRTYLNARARQLVPWICSSPRTRCAIAQYSCHPKTLPAFYPYRVPTSWKKTKSRFRQSQNRQA